MVHSFTLFKSPIVYKWLLSFYSMSMWIDWLIDWLIGVYTQTAIFQPYLSNEHEVGYKMNMKWKMGSATRIGLTDFYCHWKWGKVGRVRKLNLLWCRQGFYSCRIPQQRSLRCEERGALLWFAVGFLYYGLMTQAWSFPLCPPMGRA